jgi:long-chain acyl-CoA synthetase
MSDQVQTLSQALLAAMDDYTDRVCFRVKQAQRYRNVSYGWFRTLVYRLSDFYIDYGLTEGDRIVIIADNCLEWMVAYVACIVAGGVAVPVPTSLTSEMMCAILRDVGARLVIVHDDRQSRILESIVQDLPDLETVIAVNEASLLGAFSMSTVFGRSVSAEDIEGLRTHTLEIEPSALAAIHYTTGKTDRPRGATFDQGQRLSAMRHLGEWLSLSEDDLAFSFAPWSYVPSLDVSLFYFVSGVTNVLTSSRQTTYENLQQTSPTLGLLAPSVLEEFYNTTIERVNQWPRSTREVFAWALAMSKELRGAGMSASQELQERHIRADMTFFSQIRGWLGGRLRRVYSVGAPLPMEVADFLEAIGLTVLNIYNTTEAGGFPAASRLENHRADSVGQVAAGYQIRIAEDGEVLVRGETVMREYWRGPEDTQQVIDVDRWLHTGDLGRFDSDGYLYLTGSKQPLIVLTTGRKVVPATIESALIASPFVDQAIVFGDGQLYVSALIVPNVEAIAAHLEQEGEKLGDPGTPSNSSQVRRVLDEVVEQVNGRLARWERVLRYSVVDRSLDETGEELAPAAIDRKSIVDQHATQVEAMRSAPAELSGRAHTQVEVDPEELRALVEKRDILDAWIQDAGISFLLDLAREKQISGPSMVSICDTVAAIAQMQSEEKPLSTALIVGDPARIARILPHSEIQLHRYDLVRRMRQVVLALTKMVDGLVLGYGLDKHGVVRGIHKLDVQLNAPGNAMLGPWFRRHAAISRDCDAVVLFVPPGGRQVRVFADGQPVGRYANGNWSPESVSCDQDAVQRLAEQRGYSLELLEKILRCAFLMSEKNLGAIFVIGDADAVLARSDSAELGSYATIVNTDVRDLTDDELINFAKQDGATVIDAGGRFRGCMVLLRPSADTEAEVGLGRGARHSSAAKISAEAQSLAITVSQDGPVTVYDNGRRVLSL